ncbi:DUF4249 domain-containing protein [Lacinutrix chionoecetis]
MKRFKLTYHFVIIIISIISFSCREEIALETETFESVLVVEATITNELKQHEVKLSRTYLLEGSEQTLENNAEVRVTDNTGNSFNFSQNSNGVYVADTPFEALPDLQYTLLINTTDGKSYSSNPQTLTPISQIDNLYPEYTVDDTNGENITVFLDSDNSITNANYFRYEFEETYKIIAPFHSESNSDAEIIDYDPQTGTYQVLVTPKEQEERVCFTTKQNTEIILKNTSELTESVISRFAVRKIEIDNSILITRYSIKVRQFVQTLEAHEYYKTIKTLGNNDNLLSENQPGYVQGNITNNNGADRVVGFFEVASVTSERIYFNYQDFNIPEPPYFFECDFLELSYGDYFGAFIDGDPDERALLRFKIISQNYKHVYGTTGGELFGIVNPTCGDCTTFSSNIQPDFWID